MLDILTSIMLISDHEEMSRPIVSGGLHFQREEAYEKVENDVEILRWVCDMELLLGIIWHFAIAN